MRKAVLLYNPDSGGNRSRRLNEVQSALAILRNAGVEADLVLTESTAHAGEHASRAIAEGCDTVFACGGDGTIHNILQVLAQTNVALAILPMGTGNTLAHDLKLPLKVTAAAEAALRATPRRIALGRIQFLDLKGNTGIRHFVVTAGVGVDAHLFYKLNNGIKQRWGMTAYYLQAWHLWWTYPMTRFHADYVEAGESEPCHADLTELMSVRIRNFGGVLRELAPGASLDRDDLRLVLCHTASRFAYLTYVTQASLGLRRAVKGIELVHSKNVACKYLQPDIAGEASADQHSTIYVEADGELLGTLPVEITAVPDALTVLAPA
jgi:YegS/Rv2252/BmrU family lipid kinase